MMREVEIIRLRAAPERAEAALAVLRAETERCRRDDGAAVAMALRHDCYPGDLAAVLGWDERPLPTRAGAALAETLRRFGPVEHGVWRCMDSLLPDTPITNRV